MDNPKYAKRAEEHGHLLMDDINKPLDRAIWWLEYALRHPGMEHLRSPLHDVPWYQLMLLDVIGFLVLITVVLAYLAQAICKFLIRKITKSSKIKSD